MISLIQRVSRAAVSVEGEIVGAIGQGLLALVAIERGDGQPQLKRSLELLLNYRVFADAQGKMNRSLSEVAGGLLLVSQFTLAADTRKGLRPSFACAASPEQARYWFDQLVLAARARHPLVSSGVFAANMQIELVNDGPVTFHLRVPPSAVIASAELGEKSN